MKIETFSKPGALNKVKIPMLLNSVQAGFPSPADDYIENVLDLNELFQVDEISTFFVRAEGESMVNSGIISGDVLCVRRDLDPTNGSIVIAAIDNEYTVKRFRKTGKKVVLESANPEYSDIEPLEAQDVQIWGVVTGLARIFKK